MPRTTLYFNVQAEGIESDELQELAQDSGAHEVPSVGEGQVVARVDAASQLKRGDEAELWLDTSKLHFFDPKTGRTLTASEDGAQASAPSERPSTPSDQASTSADREGAADAAPAPAEEGRPQQEREQGGA